MSEFYTPEIGEPSIELKKDFLSLVSSPLEFKLDDGRALSLEPPNTNYPYAMAVFYEESINAQGKEVAIGTSYIIDPDSLIVEKSVTVHRSDVKRGPSDVSKFDQRNAKLYELVKQYESLGFTSENAINLALSVVVNDSELLEIVGQVIKAETASSEAQKELGLDQVSGTELQDVVDTIRKVIKSVSE